MDPMGIFQLSSEGCNVHRPRHAHLPRGKGTCQQLKAETTRLHNNSLEHPWNIMKSSENLDEIAKFVEQHCQVSNLWTQKNLRPQTLKSIGMWMSSTMMS